MVGVNAPSNDDSAELKGEPRIAITPYIRAPQARSDFAVRFEHAAWTIVTNPVDPRNELELDGSHLSREEAIRERAFADLCGDLQSAAIHLLRAVYYDHPGDCCDKQARVRFTIDLVDPA